MKNEKMEKIKIINKLIEEIKENAINDYESQFDENSGMSIVDWENGYRGTIRDFDGGIIKYISYSQFKNLYQNLDHDIFCISTSSEKLNKVSLETLDKIIKYLEEEKKYTNYNDLDREVYFIEDFEEMEN